MANATLRQKGVTLVELMVAVLIGLLSLYAVYRAYEGTERTKRTAISVGDAQITGLYSIFVLEHDLKSAGARIMTPLDASGEPGNGALLAHCSNAGNVWATKPGSMGSSSKTKVTLSLRPIPVLIVPNRNNFDDIFIFFGNSSFHLDPVTVTASDGSYTTIATPFGFKQGDVLVDSMAQAGKPEASERDCRTYVVPKNSLDRNGNFPADTMSDTVTLHLQGAAKEPEVKDRLIDLGVPVRRHFYVDSKNTLQMEEWRFDTDKDGVTAWRPARTDPLVFGVVGLRAMYGIGDVTASVDVNGNRVIGPVKQWLPANSPWNSTALLSAPLDTIRQIKAVWLSIIVQADEPELDSAVAATLPTTLTPFSACPKGTACPPSVAVTLPTGWRYRMYETVVPLVNTIQN
ncbi:MAG: PilW family protein [Betaproteobacteria bacterium]|nr:PilW family protein [Betaproteobacteria bacterium]